MDASSVRIAALHNRMEEVSVGGKSLGILTNSYFGSFIFLGVEIHWPRGSRQIYGRYIRINELFSVQQIAWMLGK